MLNHYTRHAGDPEQTRYRYANQDIDPARTHLNYAIFARDDPAAFVQSKIDEVDVKPKGGDKATNVISDWVITLPKNPALKGREREFFQTAYDHMLKTVPEELVVGAWVHMDENQPHMHFCFCPKVKTAVMTNDKSRPLLDAQGRVKRDKKGTPRYERVQVRDSDGKPVYRSSFGQTKVYTRARMKKFHPDLEKAMEGHFGFKVGIELEDKGEKLLSDLKQPDYIKAKETMSRQQSRIRALEAKEVETRGKLGALTDELKKSGSNLRISIWKSAEKRASLTICRMKSSRKFWISPPPRPNVRPCHRDWSPFGNEKERLLGTLRSFDPSLPRLGAGKLRTGLESAQSSIASLMDAVRSERESKAALSALESESRRLERELER